VSRPATGTKNRRWIQVEQAPAEQAPAEQAPAEQAPAEQDAAAPGKPAPGEGRWRKDVPKDAWPGGPGRSGRPAGST